MGTTWVVKASKLCNMRCSYCYEWDELDRKERVDIELWRRILTAVRDMQRLQTQVGPASPPKIILHGGEPLILPVNYLQTVVELTAEIVGSDVTMAVQTNALTITDAMLSFLKEANIGVGVSYDVVSGVRRTVSLQPADTRIETNIQRLQDAGLCRSGIVVLAAHTVPRLREIYAWYAQRQMNMRVLPLFDGPDTRPSGYAISNDAIAHALCDLFEHWLSTGAKIRVEPFPELLAYVAAKVLALKLRPFDRGIDGERLLVVNTNGDLYHLPEAYSEGLALGNLNSMTIEDIVAGVPYWLSIERGRARFQQFCGSCEYSSSCGGLPLQQLYSTGPHSGRCPVIHTTLTFIEQLVVEGGFSRDELAGMMATSSNISA